MSFIDREARILFTGDAVYAGSILGNFDGTDLRAYRETLLKLAELTDQVDAVFPAHYASPLEPEILARMHKAYEEIWAGRTPDIQRNRTDIFRFDEFSFWLWSGSYGKNVS